MDDAVLEILFCCTLYLEEAAEKAGFEGGLPVVVSSAVYDTETLTLMVVFSHTREQAVDFVNAAAAVFAEVYHVVSGSPNEIESSVFSATTTAIWNGNNA